MNKNIRISMLMLLLLMPISHINSCLWLFHHAAPKVMTISPTIWQKTIKQIVSARAGCMVLGVALAASLVYAVWLHKRAQKIAKTLEKNRTEAILREKRACAENVDLHRQKNQHLDTLGILKEKLEERYVQIAQSYTTRKADGLTV